MSENQQKVGRPEKSPSGIRWEIEGVLARAHRPGYWGDPGSREAANGWLEAATSLGIKAILCLLSNRELHEFYGDHGIDLLRTYRRRGFKVAHVPVEDHQTPPLGPAQILSVRLAFSQLPRPLLIHCSAGVDRTGVTVELFRRLRDADYKAGRCAPMN